VSRLYVHRPHHKALADVARQEPVIVDQSLEETSIRHRQMLQEAARLEETMGKMQQRQQEEAMASQAGNQQHVVSMAHDQQQRR
jgi:hypothetical protein